MHALSTQGEHFASRNNGEYEESEHYYAAAQFGHILELKMPEEYPGRENLGSWQLENLPFFPKKYEYKVRKDAKKRFETIRSLLRNSDVSQIYHCGDPDREGQILIDIVLKECGNKKPVLRPQLKALTDDAIVEAFRSAKPNSYYRDVYNEGMTRMCVDFDYGINLSRYTTLKTEARPALNVGRVIGAIVTEIYNRDTSIETFVPEEYFKVISDVEGGFKLVSKERFDAKEKDKAENWARRLQAGDSIVKDVQRKNVTKSAPKLFSQTSLQAAMSKRFGYDPEKTLQLSQSLYEKGLISYPRTNTSYIATEEKSVIRTTIEKINAKGYLEFKDKKSIFDDSKIDGHSAITVTGKHPSSCELSDDEMNCYKAILYRFMAVFCKEPCIYDKTTVVIENPLEVFKVSGEILVQRGWQRFEPKSKKPEKKKGDEDEDDERTLPAVSVGDKIRTDFNAVSAETKPPKHYTVETLGKWMENPFRKEDATDEEDFKNILAGIEIGTSATRAGILTKATEKTYISLKKKAYHIEPRGRFLVEASKGLGIDFSASMTAEMGRRLKAVGNGNIGVMEVINTNRRDVSRIISADSKGRVVKDSEKSGGMGEYVAKEKTLAAVYQPTGEKVSFSREWGSHRFTDEEIERLLSGEEISFQMESKKGNLITIEGSLEKQKYKGKTFWGFSMKEREFPESWSGHTFTEEEKRILLKNCKKEDRMIYVEDLWSEKKKKIYAAHLVWNKSKGRIEPVFKKGSGK